MILPDRFLPPERSLIVIGGEVLRVIADHGPLSVSELWEALRRRPGPWRTLSFDWFSLALALLYAMLAIDLEDNVVVMGSRDRRG